MVCDWCGGIIFGDKYWTVTGLSGNFCSERCCEEAKARQRLEDAGVRCQWCSKLFDPREIVRTGGVYMPGFCSMACFNAYKASLPPAPPPSASQTTQTPPNGSSLVPNQTEIMYGDPYCTNIPIGAMCNEGVLSDLWCENLGWTFNKNTITITYSKITNKSPWETGSLRFGVYTSPQNTFDFDKAEDSISDERDWKNKNCYLWGSSILNGLKQGNYYPAGNSTIEIPKELYKKISKKVYIAVVLQEAGVCFWNNRFATTGLTTGITDLIRTKASGLVFESKSTQETQENQFCYCEECGAKNKKSNAFCEECGAKLGE